MLRESNIPPILGAVKAYLQDTLGIEATNFHPWQGELELPFYLRDAFEYWQFDIFDFPAVLAIDRNTGKRSISEISQRLGNIKGPGGTTPIYVAESMASFERRRFIELKTPFVVPGNQLFLPFFGVDLRAHFRRAIRPLPDSLTPSTQAILIFALLQRNWESELKSTEIAKQLQYSTMTVSRAVRELAAAGIASTHRTHGQPQSLTLSDPPRKIWERALPLLRSPVHSVWWVHKSAFENLPKRLSGLSALSKYTMLAEPKRPVFAVDKDHWKKLPEDVISKGSLIGWLQCEVWNYSPALALDRDTVDPLSLFASLKTNPDERVQASLDELIEGMGW